MDDSPTLLERMVRAGISEARAREHLAGGHIQVDGEKVTDPDRPTPPPARWMVAAQ